MQYFPGNSKGLQPMAIKTRKGVLFDEKSIRLSLSLSLSAFSQIILCYPFLLPFLITTKCFLLFSLPLSHSFTDEEATLAPFSSLAFPPFSACVSLTSKLNDFHVVVEEVMQFFLNKNFHRELILEAQCNY